MISKGEVRRGQIYIANLDPTLGSEQGKERRVLVVSNDRVNSNPRAPVAIVVPITGTVTPKKKKMPMYVPLFPTKQNGQTKEALIDCFQIRVLDIEKRLIQYKGEVNGNVMRKVDEALKMCLELIKCPSCNEVIMPFKKKCVSCNFQLLHRCISCEKEHSNEYIHCPFCGLKRGEKNDRNS